MVATAVAVLLGQLLGGLPAVARTSALPGSAFPSSSTWT